MIGRALLFVFFFSLQFADKCGNESRKSIVSDCKRKEIPQENIIKWVEENQLSLDSLVQGKYN